MIELAGTEALQPVERFGLAVLLDGSRLVPVSGIPGVVRLDITNQSPSHLDLAACVREEWYLTRSDGAIGVPCAVLRLIGEVAGGVAEQRSGARDRHDRVPASENVLVAAGLERQALISRAGVLLRHAVGAVAGRRPVRLVAPWPDRRRWAVALTHDLDLVALWPAAVLARCAELALKRRFGLALKVLLGLAGNLGKNPVWRGTQSVLEPEGENSARSTWFVISETPTLQSVLGSDVTYRPESPPARRILHDLMGRGCEVGLHGSFATTRGHGVFESQRDRLAAVLGVRPLGIRQHFLRMDPARTPGKMREAGFLYDSTWGFSDRNGFRLGVADVLPAWDAGGSRTVGIEEAPFCWMDRALSKYRGVEDPMEWVRDGLALAEECRLVDGLWVGVWHPNMYPGLGFPGATEAFEYLLGELVAQRPFFGALTPLVHWRTARRQVRAVGMTAAGQVDATCSMDPGFPLHLEDLSGHPLELVRH